MKSQSYVNYYGSKQRYNQRFNLVSLFAYIFSVNFWRNMFYNSSNKRSYGTIKSSRTFTNGFKNTKVALANRDNAFKLHSHLWNGKVL